MTITFTVGDLLLLDLVSQNDIICIWKPIDSTADEALWRGPFWQCPQKYLDTQLDKIFGCIPESIVEADTINIRIIVCSNPERFSRKALNYDLVGISFISYEDYITNLSQYTERNIFIDEVSDFLEHISNFSIRGYTESK